MLALCGARPISVFAQRIGRHDSGITEDQCSLSLTFADGSIGTILYTAEGNRGLEKEYFEAHADGKSLTMHDFRETRLYADGRTTQFKTSKREKGFAQEMARFVQAVEAGLPPVMPFEDIESATRACLLAVQSLQSGSVYSLS
jgi:predicted dehydrogenase